MAVVPVVERARANYEYSKTLTFDAVAPGRWDGFAEKVDSLIKQIATVKQAMRVAAIDIPFTHFLEPSLNEKNIWVNLLSLEFPWFALEMTRIGANTFCPEEASYRPEELDGGIVFNNMYFWHLRSLFACLTHVPNIDTVLEIGGGYGSLARLWLLNIIRPAQRYVIVDLPWSLFFADVMLSDEFGADAVGYVRDTVPDTRVVLCPVANLHKLQGHHDIIVNIGSFQEMSDPWVDFYMAWLDGCDSNWLYSLNYCGQPLKDMGESRTFWSPRPSREWSTRLIEHDPPLIRMQCSLRFFAEHLYERAPARGSLNDWSVKRGHKLTRKTYLEGLDLVRQSCSAQEAHEFLLTVLNFDELKCDFAPKETFFLAKTLEHAKVQGVDKIVKLLETKIQGYLP